MLGILLVDTKKPQGIPGITELGGGAKLCGRVVTQHLGSLHVFRVSSIVGLEQVGNVVGAFDV